MNKFHLFLYYLKPPSIQFLNYHFASYTLHLTLTYDTNSLSFFNLHPSSNYLNSNNFIKMNPSRPSSKNPASLPSAPLPAAPPPSHPPPPTHPQLPPSSHEVRLQLEDQLETPLRWLKHQMIEITKIIKCLDYIKADPYLSTLDHGRVYRQERDDRIKLVQDLDLFGRRLQKFYKEQRHLMTGVPMARPVGTVVHIDITGDDAGSQGPSNNASSTQAHQTEMKPPAPTHQATRRPEVQPQSPLFRLEPLQVTEPSPAVPSPAIPLPAGPLPTGPLPTLSLPTLAVNYQAHREQSNTLTPGTIAPQTRPSYPRFVYQPRNRIPKRKSLPENDDEEASRPSSKARLDARPEQRHDELRQIQHAPTSLIEQYSGLSVSSKI